MPVWQVVLLLNLSLAVGQMPNRGETGAFSQLVAK
jgi:hypothetical protein